MGHGLQKIYTATMASGGTSTSEVDLGRSYQNMALIIPTMATASNGMYILASDTTGGTYRRLKHPSINSATVATNDYVITSAATNCIVPLPAPMPFRYIKINTDATVADGCAFKIVCGD